MRKRSVRTLSTHPFAAEDELAFLRCAWNISLAPVGSFAEAMRRYTAQEKRIFLRCYIHVGNLYRAALYRVNRTNSGLINFRSTEYEDPDRQNMLGQQSSWSLFAHVKYVFIKIYCYPTYNSLISTNSAG